MKIRITSFDATARSVACEAVDDGGHVLSPRVTYSCGTLARELVDGPNAKDRLIAYLSDVIRPLVASAQVGDLKPADVVGDHDLLSEAESVAAREAVDAGPAKAG